MILLKMLSDAAVTLDETLHLFVRIKGWSAKNGSLMGHDNGRINKRKNANQMSRDSMTIPRHK
jgi:hypothetical protein